MSPLVAPQGAHRPRRFRHDAELCRQPVGGPSTSTYVTNAEGVVAPQCWCFVTVTTTPGAALIPRALATASIPPLDVIFNTTCHGHHQPRQHNLQVVLLKL